MESSWSLVIFLSGILTIVIIACFVSELSKTPEQKKREADMARERYEKERSSWRIVEVTPLGLSGTQFKRGGLGGALFGGFIGGIPGAVIGAVLPSGKGVQTENFAVKYGDGKVIIRRCMQGSSEYKALMKRVKK